VGPVFAHASPLSTADTPAFAAAGGTDLTLKGTPAKQQLLISIVVILVILALAYFFIISPR
jgi:hypothetical protein